MGGASALKGIGSLASSAGGGKGGGSSGGGLTPEEAAAIQFAGKQEAMKLTSAYTDYGIPFSSGLAYDLGSIPFQSAAQAGQIEAGQAGQQASQQNQIGNQLASLGTTLGSLNLGGQNQGGTNTNTTGAL